MTAERDNGQRRAQSMDSNLTDEERATLRSLLDAWARQRRMATLVERPDTDSSLPLEAELAIAASVERHILEWAASMRHDAERIERRARERLLEIDEAMQQLHGLVPANGDQQV